MLDRRSIIALVSLLALSSFALAVLAAILVAGTGLVVEAMRAALAEREVDR